MSAAPTYLPCPSPRACRETNDCLGGCMSKPAYRLKRGAYVRILRRDIFEFRNWTKRRPRGYVMRVDGGYVYVRPNAWKGPRHPLELYENEIEVIREA